MSFLEADAVTVRFGGLTAVDALSLTADEGEIVGLIGPNGAGKTTFFGAVSGLVPMAEGAVRIDGVDVSGWPAHRRARSGIARTFQKLEVFGSMTVRENLEYATEAASLGDRPWRLFSIGRGRGRDDANEIIDLLDLGAVADTPASALPIGTARVVEFGRALCARPRLLLLDEPSSGLDASETAVFGAHVARTVAERGVGVLLIEHDMSLVLSLCQRLSVLEFGQLIAAGPTDEVAASPEVRAAYLGETSVVG